ncbi:MAG TPA: GTP-binding protein [Nocardioidaceae bacterium]|nr:GTP-binding protein [Nocardioidaceae bacterium]
MSTNLRLPVVVLSGVRKDEQDLAALSVACSLPEPVVLRHELHVTEGYLRRVVSDTAGVVEDVSIPLEHACLTCALRYEIVPSLVRLAKDNAWSSVLLNLPTAAEPLPLVRAIQHTVVDGRPVSDWLDVRSVIAAFEPERLLDDIFGDALLEEQDADRHPGDRRAVGEVLAQQLEYADLLVAAGGGLCPAGSTLLEELRRPDSLVVKDMAGIRAEDLLERSRSQEQADRFVDPTTRSPQRDVRPSGAEIVDVSHDSSSEIWTLLVDTWRPFHPGRLMERIEAIGGDGMRGRGCFWLPSRPNAVAVWDGAGGQLSIGTSGTWEGRTPRTRLVITGVGDGKARVAGAVEKALMTEAELAVGLHSWLRVDDGFDPWLGDYSEVA